jgi:hypothetical protein
MKNMAQQREKNRENVKKFCKQYSQNSFSTFLAPSLLFLAWSLQAWSLLAWSLRAWSLRAWSLRPQSVYRYWYFHINYKKN